MEHWHAWLGDPTMADAILDRLLAREERINLKGDSLRRTARKPDDHEGGTATDD